MEQIREGVFETNSSSTHSLVILTDPGILKCYKVAAPEVYDEIKKRFNEDTIYYTKEEIYSSFIAIGATIEDGVLDLKNVNRKEYDFGYVEKVYGDPAHKFLLALTCEGENYVSFDGEGFRERLYRILHNLGIRSIRRPIGGFTGIDHQNRDKLVSQVGYNLESFLLRRDYILRLSHD